MKGKEHDGPKGAGGRWVLKRLLHHRASRVACPSQVPLRRARSDGCDSRIPICSPGSAGVPELPVPGLSKRLSIQDARPSGSTSPTGSRAVASGILGSHRIDELIAGLEGASVSTSGPTTPRVSDGARPVDALARFRGRCDGPRVDVCPSVVCRAARTLGGGVPAAPVSPVHGPADAPAPAPRPQARARVDPRRPSRGRSSAGSPSRRTSRARCWPRSAAPPCSPGERCAAREHRQTCAIALYYL